MFDYQYNYYMFYVGIGTFVLWKDLTSFQLAGTNDLLGSQLAKCVYVLMAYELAVMTI